MRKVTERTQKLPGSKKMDSGRSKISHQPLTALRSQTEIDARRTWGHIDLHWAVRLGFSPRDPVRCSQ